MALRPTASSGCVMGVLFASFGLATMFAGEPRTVDLYVAVADANDRPLSDLTTADFVVRVGDSEEPVTSVKLATGPVSLVFVNDTAIEDVQAVRRAFQSGVAALATRDPGSRVSVSVWQQRTTFQDAHTLITKPDPFDGSLSNGYSLPTATVHAIDALKAAPGRHVVLGVTRQVFPPDSPTSRVTEIVPSSDLIAALRSAKTSFWVIEIAPILSGNDADPYLERAAWSSGGWKLRINDRSALLPTMDRLVDILLSQYIVSVRGSSTGTAGRIRVGVKRAGATVSTAEYPQG